MGTDIRKLPIVMISMSRWDGDLSSAALSIARELSKTNKVFYFDYPYTYKDYWKGRGSEAIRKRKQALLYAKDIYTRVSNDNPNLIAVTPPLMIPFSFLGTGYWYRKALEINNARFFKCLHKVVRDHRITDYIFFNSFNPFYAFKWKEVPRPVLHIYQTRDNIRAIPFWAAQGPQQERLAASIADVRLATSSQLVKLLEKDTGQGVHLLPNAAETELFKSTLSREFERPGVLEGVERPVIAYVGHIGPRIDFSLVNKLVKEHRDKLFLMIGPEGSSTEEVQKLKQFENVKFTGAVPLEDIPRYLKFVDCSIIPFVKDELTRSIYPLKLNEHLAAGKAVVTTDFSKDVLDFEDVVFVARNPEEFSELIDEALAAKGPAAIEQRVKRVEANSWSNRVEKFWEILEQQLKTKASANEEYA